MLRDPQGMAIERLQKHANKEISREDFTTMNCAILPDLINMCGHLKETHNIDSIDRVYTGLCYLGRKRGYHAYMQNGKRDIFGDIAELVRIGRTSLNAAKMTAANTPINLFDMHLRTEKLGTSVDENGLLKKLAGSWRIQKSHLNLYHALTGLKYIVEDEPEYILVRDNPVIDDPLRLLTRANMRLNDQKAMLQAWMAI